MLNTYRQKVDSYSHSLPTARHNITSRGQNVPLPSDKFDINQPSTPSLGYNRGKFKMVLHLHKSTSYAATNVR